MWSVPHALVSSPQHWLLRCHARRADMQLAIATLKRVCVQGVAGDVKPLYCALSVLLPGRCWGAACSCGIFETQAGFVVCVCACARS